MTWSGRKPNFSHTFDVDDFPRVGRLARLVESHAIGNQLHIVLVRRDHVALEVFPFRPLHQSADDVVGLPAGDFQHGDIVGLDDALQIRQLVDHVVGHFLPRRLVFRVPFVPEGRMRRVEGHGDVFGLLLLEDFLQRRDEAVHRAGVHALRVDQRPVDEGEVGAVGDGHAVNDEKAFHACRALFHACRALFHACRALFHACRASMNGE
jgi:hypothetical protein